MAHRGPVITAIVVLGGLAGFLTANTTGGPAGGAADPKPAAGTSAQTPSVTKPPATNPPRPTESAPPTSATTTTSAPPARKPPRFPAEVVYAGKARNDPLTLAVAVKGAKSSAYLCDGVGVESWLHGTARDGRVSLVSKDGAGRLVAALAGKRLAGTITLGGKKIAFDVGVAPPPAGLYRAKNGVTDVGWIVLPDGKQVGVATTNGRAEPAPAIDLAAGAATVDGRRMTVAKVDGDS